MLKLDQLINLDTTGLEALDHLRDTLAARGGRMILCGATSQPLSLMRRTGFLERLGDGNCVGSLEQALERANH